MSASTRAGRLRESLFPSLLCAFTLFIYGPFSIYGGNPGELEVGYPLVLGVLVLPAILLIAVLSAPALVLPSSRGMSPSATVWFHFGEVIGRWKLGAAFDYISVEPILKELPELEETS